MSSTLYVIGLVVEGPNDARTVPDVVDRILVKGAPALEGKLGDARTYRGSGAGAPFLAWSGVRQRAKGRVPRRHGHFDGERATEDARAAVEALRLFVAEDPRPAAVLLVRDSDGKRDERRKGLEQARSDADWPFQVVIGVAHPMRECWVLAGFVPDGEVEEAKLRGLRKELGLDPTIRSHELDASKETAKRSAKRVLAELTAGDRDREEMCWSAADVGRLRERGEENGLAAFVGEVERQILPIIAART